MLTPLPARLALRTPRRSVRLALCAGVLLSACGGGRKSTVAGGTPPDVEADFSSMLQPDAPLTAAVRPDDLRGLLEDLIDRSVGLQAILHHSDASLLLDPGFLPAFDIDGARPAWVAVRGGPVAGLLESAEDVSRVLQAPDQLSRWLADNPPPAAWRHVRLVGYRRVAAPGAPDTPLSVEGAEAWLGEHMGALQTLAPTDTSEMWAAALDCAPDVATRTQATLAALGDYRLILLLDAHTPTAVAISGVRRPGGQSAVDERTEGASHGPVGVSIDWVEDVGLRPGGLLAGLDALVHVGGAAPTGRPNDAGSGAGERISGSPSHAEIARLNIAHTPWIRWSRAMAEAEVLVRALRDPELPLENRGAMVQDARRAAARPEALVGPGALLFRTSRLSLGRVHDVVTLDIDADYTSRSRKLGQLGDGQAPLPASAIVGAGVAAVTVAAGARHARAFDEVAPLPVDSLDRFLGDVLVCGYACWPAVWTSIPSYARQPGAAVGSVFPEVAPFAEPLTGALGAAFVVEGAPKPGLALAVRYGRGLAEPQARWRAAVPTLEQRAVHAGDDPVLVLGNHADALELVSRSVGGAAVPAEALVDGDFSGPVSTLFGRFSVRLLLGAQALQVQTRWTLLPLAPPSEADATPPTPTPAAKR